MKNTISSKVYSLSLISSLLSCIIFLTSCSGDISSHSSTITPIGAPIACLTLHVPSLVKLADGNYKLVDQIDNCGSKDAGPLQITVQIDQQTMNLLGPATIPANGKATYNTFTGRTGETDKEIHFPSPSPSSTAVTILATISGKVQGEWDGNVTIPA